MLHFHRPSPLRCRPLVLAHALLLALAAAGCGEDAPPQPRRETVAGYTVVHLVGTPFEMGQQHARLLRQELLVGVEEIRTNTMLKLMFAMAQGFKLDELAQKLSLPEVLEECKGMVDVLGAEGWTLDKCLVLNFGDPIAEFVSNGLPPATDLTPGCAQAVVSGSATSDGRLYHARILDWAKIDFIIDYPVIFVRHPAGGVPHVVIGFPGNLSPYQGMNAEGLALASNEINPKDNTVNDLTGISHVQLQGRMLATARTLDEVKAAIAKANHMSLEVIVASDGKTSRAAVFEMAPQAVDVRELSDGVVTATNHFVGGKTDKLDRDPASPNSLERYTRLQQLVPRGGSETLYGKLEPKTLVQVMRDRKNPTTGKTSDSVFDDEKSLATNGALFQLVFDPQRRLFWVAAGKIPVPAQPFTGFSLDALLGREGSHPASLP